MPAPLLRIDARSGTAAYRQIADALRALLVQGTLAPGNQLPPVRELALDLGVHFNTVAQAYRVLAEEGWLELRRRRGARVLARKPPDAPGGAADSFGRRLRELVAEHRSAGLPPPVIVRELRALAEGLRK
ncbi:MAG: GntR family transcriptional regulator [Bryobacteraceae bacterium]